MDRFRDGRLVTGIGMAAAAGVDSGGGGGSPFSCSISFSIGTGPFNVSGASGNLYTSNGGVIGVIESGGTPPYGGSTTLNGDASGKLFITPASDGVHNTIGWSGFSVNETEGCYIQFNGNDSLGATDSSRYPPIGQVIAIKRTS